MDVEKANKSVMDYILGLKSEVRLSDLGKPVVRGFVSFVVFFVVAIMHFFAPVLLGLQGLTMKRYAEVLAVIATIFVFYNIVAIWKARNKLSKARRSCKETDMRFCLSFSIIWVVLMAGAFYFISEYSVNSFWFLFGTSSVYVLLGFSHFVYLLFGPANESDAESSRTQMRILHSNKIKYVFLGIISGDDTDHSKMSDDLDYADQNKKMLKKIRNSKNKKTEQEIYKRYESYMPAFTSRINTQIIETESRQKTVDIAIIISTIVSFIIVAVDKIYDAASNYITVRYKFEVSNLPTIDEMPPKDALNLTDWILDLSFYGAVLILLSLLAVFFGYKLLIDYLNQRNATTLVNLRYAQNALWDIDHEISYAETIAENGEADNSEQSPNKSVSR